LFGTLYNVRVAASSHASLRQATPREQSIFACVCDVVVAPAEPLPRVSHTDAAAAFARLLAASPTPNALGLRALLYAIELAPLALGSGARLRRLPRAERVRVLARLEGLGALDALKALAYLAYYGDDSVARQLGYDATERVELGRRLRAQEAWR
jgi:hypothetical protein